MLIPRAAYIERSGRGRGFLCEDKLDDIFYFLRVYSLTMVSVNTGECVCVLGGWGGVDCDQATMKGNWLIFYLIFFYCSSI